MCQFGRLKQKARTSLSSIKMQNDFQNGRSSVLETSWSKRSQLLQRPLQSLTLTDQRLDFLLIAQLSSDRRATSCSLQRIMRSALLGQNCQLPRTANALFVVKTNKKPLVRGLKTALKKRYLRKKEIIKKRTKQKDHRNRNHRERF